MALSGLPLHGGDLAAAEARWGRPERGWLDLSTGINPWPYPLPAIPAEAWHRLPDAAAETGLRRVVAEAWGVPDPAMVVPAPGSQALIQTLPRLFSTPISMQILGPTYGEHARAWTAAGHRVAMIAPGQGLEDSTVRLVVNPNNPDGRSLQPGELRPLAGDLAARQGLLVVDEAFTETRPGLSLAGSVAPGMVVLRSFGKFHGLAGLRLGFAVASPPLAERLRSLLGPWAVSGPALAVGTVALADRAWSEATAARLTAAAEALAVTLRAGGLEVAGGTSLFLLARHPDADRIYERLGRAGILVRAFADRPLHLRFGLPGGEADRARLAEALAGQ